MVEIRGNEKVFCDGLLSGNRRANSTLHWGVDKTKDKYTKTRWSEYVLLLSYFPCLIHFFKTLWHIIVPFINAGNV